MPTMPLQCIRDVKFPQSAVDSYTMIDGTKYLSGLSRLNVFIGPNNSGKSRFLRHLFINDNPTFSTNAENEADLRHRMEMAKRALQPITIPESGVLTNQLRDIRASLEPRWRSKSDADPYGPHALLSRRLNLHDIRGGAPQWFNSACRDVGEDASKAWDSIVQFADYAHRHKDTKPQAQPMHHAYIPSIRSLHHFEEDPAARPHLPTITRTVSRAYFKEHGRLNEAKLNALGDFDETRASLFTGGELYSVLVRRLLGNREQRDRVRGLEKWLSTSFFDGNDITLIPHIESNVVHVRIGDEERGIESLGDGIQQLIILTMPLFLFKGQHLLLFIEEPELYLHPGYQRAFIDLCLNPLDERHQVFVATHSHQFIDITVDRDLCSVFKFNKVASGESPQFTVQQSSTDDFDLLRLLGVRNSTLLLSNCTIWVEGVYDRLYFRHYLELYQEHLRERETPFVHKFFEDLHYSFVEYNGSNITHLSFLDEENGIDARRLCGEMFLISDYDKPGDAAKDIRRAKLTAALGDNFAPLPCREVENLLAPMALMRVVRLYERWEDERQPDFNEDDYAVPYMGDFIEQKILKGEPSARGHEEGNRPYAARSGTIKDKDAFCKKAISVVQEWSDVSSRAQNLTRRIFNFICQKNGITPPET